MNKVFLAALISLMTIPAMANTNTSAEAVDAQELSAANPEFYFADELEALAQQDESEVMALRPGDGRRDRDDRWGRRGFRCVAQNRFRQRFVGFDNNLRRAQHEALRSCESRTRFGSCRLVGCTRTRN